MIIQTHRQTKIYNNGGEHRNGKTMTETKILKLYHTKKAAITENRHTNR